MTKRFLHRVIYHRPHSDGVQWVVSPNENFIKFNETTEKVFKLKRNAVSEIEKKKKKRIHYVMGIGLRLKKSDSNLLVGVDWKLYLRQWIVWVRFQIGLIINTTRLRLRNL